MRMTQDQISSYYETHKLALAAFLIASGKAKLLSASLLSDGATVVFHLSEQPSDTDIATFFNGSATVSALRLVESMTNLKNVVFETKRSARRDAHS